MALPVALAPSRNRSAWLRRGLRTLALGLALLATGCGTNGLPFLGDDESLAGPRVPYAVLFEGIDEADDPGLAAFLTGTSNAAQSMDRPPPSLLILRNRARDDVPRLVTALQARGFYDGSVDFRIEQDPVDEQPTAVEGLLDTILGTPATRIVFEIEPGERYQFDRRTVRIEGERHGYSPRPFADLDLKQGDPAIAEVVLTAEERLLRHARGQGHAQAALGDRRTIIDRDTRRMDVELAIRPGPRFDFAEPVVTGQTDIDDAFLRQRLLIEPGQRYDVREVDRARRRLIDTNLFSTVRVFEGPEPDEDGNWPPPPLDGSAHTWHHPWWQLKDMIRYGGQARGGTRPSFEEQIDEEDAEAIISWLQSHWPDEVYEAWLDYDRSTPTPADWEEATGREWVTHTD